MFYDAVANNHGLVLDPFKALIAPRPIGWISTLGKTGVVNLAPYSFFNAVSEDPHYVMFASGGRKETSAWTSRSNPRPSPAGWLPRTWAAGRSPDRRRGSR